MDVKRLVQQFLKFSVVGVIAFVIDFGVMGALTELVGLPPVVSTAWLPATSGTCLPRLSSLRW
jgi:putative flippase GtrA